MADENDGEEQSFKIKVGGDRYYDTALQACSIGDEVMLYEHDDGINFYTADKAIIGSIGARAKLAKALDAGAVLIDAKITRIVAATDDSSATASILVRAGPTPLTGDEINARVARTVLDKLSALGVTVTIGDDEDDDDQSFDGRSREYPVGLVGEQHYQPAIAALKEGAPVDIFLERGNPFDDGALVVKAAGGQTIGYIPKDCWVARAVLDEGKRPDAVIRSIDRESAAFANVVLSLAVEPGQYRTCDYPSPPVEAAASAEEAERIAAPSPAAEADVAVPPATEVEPKRGFWSRLFGK